MTTGSPIRFLEALRALLQTWQGFVLAILALLGALYYGPRKMLETWDWYWDRFRDNEVFLIVSRRRLQPRAGVVSNWQPREMNELPYFTAEIANDLGRTEKSVGKSLERLMRRGKIEPYQLGWRMRV